MKAKLAIILASTMTTLSSPACAPTEAEQFRALSQEVNRMKVENIDLERRLGSRDATIAVLQQQLANLRAGAGAPQAPLFDIEKLDILDLTSGADIDGLPGDDAIAVYFRPVDSDGDALKRGGHITVKLFDHTDSGPAGSRQIGYLNVVKPDAIAGAWYGKFWTNHYKLIVPIAPEANLSAGQEVDVLVQFVDQITGIVYTARKVVRINLVRPDPAFKP